LADLAGDVDAVLDEAELKNVPVREYVRFWAEHTGAERVEVVSASDDARLIRETLEAGEILPAGEQLYYSRSDMKDTARSEERTVVATNNPADQGVSRCAARSRWRSSCSSSGSKLCPHSTQTVSALAKPKRFSRSRVVCWQRHVSVATSTCGLPSITMLTTYLSNNVVKYLNQHIVSRMSSDRRCSR
jgi:hypothetical protein